jgi:hypothetical protein
MRLVEKQSKVPVAGAFVFGAEVEVETVLPTVHVFKRGQLAADISALPAVKGDVRELLAPLV